MSFWQELPGQGRRRFLVQPVAEKMNIAKVVVITKLSSVAAIATGMTILGRIEGDSFGAEGKEATR